MLSEARKWLKKHDFDFIITGEVVGQRPNSQRRDAMAVIEKQSLLKDILLRPLSAKLLPETFPEREKMVDRELLFDINGRSRKNQLDLVKQFNIEDFPQPAGGCFLTEPNFCKRLSDFWEYKGDRDYLREDIELLRLGRHLYLKPDLKVIIGRNESENRVLEGYCNNFINLKIVSHTGPIALVYNKKGSKIDSNYILLAAKEVTKYSKIKDTKPVELEVDDGKIYKIEL